MPLSLTLLHRTEIERVAPDFDELSGLTLSPAGDVLWMVSDDTSKIRAFSLQGEPREELAFRVAATGLEGIAMDPSGAHLFAVSEGAKRISQFSSGEGEVLHTNRLDRMTGYERIEAFFDPGETNKGLEGICVLESGGGLLVLKEAKPRLLIRVSYDLETITGHRELRSVDGFYSLRVDDDQLDVSGLCHDRTRSKVWIVSDKGECTFLYDLESGTVSQRFDLECSTEGPFQRIKKAEGIAHDPRLDRLYVVSDEDGCLYEYQVS